MSYFTNRRGEIKELQNLLVQPKLESKMHAIRQIIAAMTVGKDVSMLFMDVIKNMEVNNLELKKLVYLYVINYAKSQPDLAILGINTFRKDALDRSNPLIRALAVRTMGSIRIEQVVEYLVDTLKSAIKDEDSYVRKTAVVCVAKMHDLAPQVLEDQGFLRMLENCLTDGNAMVVSNTVAAFQSISEAKGENALKLNTFIVQKLLTALNECNEWGQIFIIDALSEYQPPNSQEAEGILERVSSRLSHSNAAVVIATVRIIMKYLDVLVNPDLIRTYVKKLAAPLISLLSTIEPEVQFVALKNINIILQKRPNVLEKETKMFFCNFNDPIYIKLEKLEILVRLADIKNIDAILHEFRDYASEIDVEFVRKTIRAIGRCAIKLEKASEKCVTALWELLKNKVPYVVQETISVMRDIFRKYPGRYENVLKEVYSDLKMLEEPEAKASIIWVIGEYSENIENAEDLLSEYLSNFKEEQAVVQIQLLTAFVKVYLRRPQSCEAQIQQLLEIATKECENPDLRDRAFIYWRLLSKNPYLAKTIVLAEKPPISDHAYNMETSLLDKLVNNIGTLASVYGKPPEAFVKKLRDSLNQRELEIEEEYMREAVESNNNNEDAVDSTGMKISEYQEGIARNEYTEAIKNKEINLLEMDDDATASSTPQNHSQNDSGIDMMARPNQQSNGGIKRNTSARNIAIPFSLVMPDSQMGMREQASGLAIEAAFQRELNEVYLDLKLTNRSNSQFTSFAVKIDNNSFKVAPQLTDLDISNLDAGRSSEVRIEIGFNGLSDNQPPAFPFKVKAALKTQLDVFVFTIPVSLTVFLVPSQALSTGAYAELSGSPKVSKDQNKLNTDLDAERIKEKFQNNNFNYIGSRKNEGGIEMMSFQGKLINEMLIGCDAILDKNSGCLHLNYFANHPSILPLLYQAIGFILTM